MKKFLSTILIVFFQLLISNPIYADSLVTVDEVRSNIANLNGIATKATEDLLENRKGIDKLLTESLELYKSNDELANSLKGALRDNANGIKSCSKLKGGLAAMGSGLNLYELYAAVDNLSQDVKNGGEVDFDNVFPVIEKLSAFIPVYGDVASGLIYIKDEINKTLDLADEMGYEYSKSYSTIVDQYFRQYNIIYSKGINGEDADLGFYSIQRSGIRTQLKDLRKEVLYNVPFYGRMDLIELIDNAELILNDEYAIKEKQRKFFNKAYNSYVKKQDFIALKNKINALNSKARMIVETIDSMRNLAKDSVDIPTQPTPQPPSATSITLEKVKSKKSLVSVNETVTIWAYLNNEADIFKVKQMILVIDGKENPMQHSTGKLWTYEWTAKPASNNGKITYSAYANGKDGTKGTVTLGETEITVNAPAGISSLTMPSTKVPKGSGTNFTAQLSESLQNSETVWVSIDGINNQMNCTSKTCTFNVRAFNESGNRSFWGYVNDKAGKQLSKTSAVNFWVIPSALVTKVTPDKPSITEGGTATFTATVSGIVDIAKGEKVVVWVDNYQQDMKKSAGNTWTALVENISGVNGKRDYTARVQNDDVFSTEASHGTLTVKMPDTIKSVDAQKQGKPVSAFYLNDSIDFIVETKAVPKGDLYIMLNDFVHPEKLVRQGNSNLWKTTIFMGQEESKNYKAYVKMNGSVVEESSNKTLNVNIRQRQRDKLTCPQSVKTGDLMEVSIKLGDPQYAPSNAKASTSVGSRDINFKSRTADEWYFTQEIKSSHKGILNISFDTSIGSHHSCDVYINMVPPPSPAPTPEPQSQSDIVGSLDFNPLGDGFMLWKVTVSKHPPGTLKVKLQFSQGGILTESMDYTNKPIVIPLQQSGNEWSKKLKSSGKGILTYNIQYWINGKLAGEVPGVFKEPYADIMCETSLNGTNMSITCYYTDKYYSSRGLEADCTIPSISSDKTSGTRKIFKLQQHVKQNILLTPGHVTCDVYHDDATVKVEHSHFEYLIAGGNIEDVTKLYRLFQEAYNSKNESKIMALISDDWESTGDGTTSSDLSVNLRNSFKIFDQIGCTISNLQITPGASGKYVARYDITIKGTIFKGNIRHEEKSSVSEEVTVDDSGKARITKTLNGRFWSVQ